MLILSSNATVERQWEHFFNPSHSIIFSYPDWPITLISRSQDLSTSNVWYSFWQECVMWVCQHRLHRVSCFVANKCLLVNCNVAVPYTNRVSQFLLPVRRVLFMSLSPFMSSAFVNMCMSCGKCQL